MKKTSNNNYLVCFLVGFLTELCLDMSPVSYYLGKTWKLTLEFEIPEKKLKIPYPTKIERVKYKMKY